MDDTCAGQVILTAAKLRSRRELALGNACPPHRRFELCRLASGRRPLLAAVTGHLLALASVFFLCGCVPLRFTTSPGAAGRLVDATTRQPISGAEVAISRSTYPPESPDKAFSNKRSPTVLSRDDGGFALPVERRVDLYCIPVDPFPRFGLLVVKREGYATTCVPFWSHSVADLGEVPVQREAK